ncbi:hypothetical protein [Actinacidiphila soli]|uniref:hypothetical protein n=1 Tax=Actinacidiphila soli TaxID=2487275 RepID=UPI000FC99FF5|nr:hypothetical protein [Actinacidiphila soli]
MDQLDLFATATQDARSWALRARTLANRALCDDQENALTVTAVQFDSAAQYLVHGDTASARAALRAAGNYAGSEEGGAPKVAEAARTILASLPA